MFSADLVVKNGSNGVQHNETVSIRLDYPLVDFSLLKPVSTSQAPAPQIQVSLTQVLKLSGNVHKIVL